MKFFIGMGDGDEVVGNVDLLLIIILFFLRCFNGYEYGSVLGIFFKINIFFRKFNK